MKTLFLLSTLLFSTSIFAQKKIDAEEIFEEINSGKEVYLTNAIIMGTLDLTELSNKEVVNKNKDYQEYKSYVNSPISFVNCIFDGDVIAYKNLQDGKARHAGNVKITWNGNIETYSTNFEEAVLFEKCVFKKKSEFKYSTFKDPTNFEGTTFVEAANFKYAEFKKLTGFGNCTFNDDANFKYARFTQDADFFKNRFLSYSNFKYAEFGDRVTFKKSKFEQYADFKYTKIKNEAVFTGAMFASTADFKYTKGKRYMN